MNNFTLGKSCLIVCLTFLAGGASPVLCQAQDRVVDGLMPEFSSFNFNDSLTIDTVLTEELHFAPWRRPLERDDAFLPFYFDGKILPKGKLFRATLRDSLFNVYKYAPPSFPTPKTDAIAELEEQLDRNAYYYFVDHYPDWLQYFYWNQPEKLEPEPLKTNIFQELFAVDNNPNFGGITGPEKFDPGWKFWFINGGSFIQFSQNYISKNWYKGGLGNLNILSNQNVTINYKKNRVQFNNFIEWNLSLYTNPVDTIRKTKIGTDLLRTYSDFGIRAFNERWFYSTNLELKTQLFNNYAENTNVVVSAFNAPLFVNMGILGMKYRLNKGYKANKYKRLTVDADISPLSLRITYVGDRRVDPTRYGIPAGDEHKTDFGSLVNSTLVFNFNKNVWLRSRFKYFTNYERMEIESENELNMALNRYFSTRIYVYARFDDTEGIPKDPALGYLQMNEILSFGFNYRW